MSNEMNRRDFLKATAATGVVFCSCALLDAAHAQQPSARRRLPVVVNGKRVKTIDVHAHCHFREIAPLLGAEASILTPPVKAHRRHSSRSRNA